MYIVSRKRVSTIKVPSTKTEGGKVRACTLLSSLEPKACKKRYLVYAMCFMEARQQLNLEERLRKGATFTSLKISFGVERNIVHDPSGKPLLFPIQH